MIKEDFYMVLPSNASPITHPNNTAGDFVVNWENPILLNPYAKWHVALTEMSYVYNPSTISNNYSITYQKYEDSIEHTYFYQLHHDANSADQLGYTPTDWREIFQQVNTTDETSIPKLRSYRDSNFMGFTCSKPFMVDLTPEFAAKLKISGTTKTSEKRSSDGFWIVPTEISKDDLIELLKTMENKVIITASVLSYRLDKATFHFPANKDFKKAESLAKYVADNCLEIFSDVVYDRNSGHMRITFHPNVTSVEFGGGLNITLGFSKAFYQDPDPESRQYPVALTPLHEITASKMPLLHRGIINMYIYASICEPVFVGHTKVPLLKNVYVDGSNDVDVVGHARNSVIYNPMYVPVASTTFSSIEVNIRNDGGQIVSFPAGSITTLTLHFRKM